MSKNSTFVWYADCPGYGELILAIEPDNLYRSGIIYCPRMIHERLRPEERNGCSSLELMLGPLGLIDQRLYEEARVEVAIPFWLRLLALIDNDALNQKSDSKLNDFITGCWRSAT